MFGVRRQEAAEACSSGCAANYGGALETARDGRQGAERMDPNDEGKVSQRRVRRELAANDDGLL